MKFSPNNLCPCGSKIKYKKCCQAFHKGKLPDTALELMRSRYVAYALQIPKYIIDTTHKDNKDYLDDKNLWESQILDFCINYDFKSLEIIDFIDENLESFVTFRVQLLYKNEDNSFTEKSKFLKIDGRWLYHSGEIN